jgi:hypothetical protein
MRDIYDQFNGEEISLAIKTIRAERTQEELLNKHQIEFVRLQALTKQNVTFIAI